MKLWDSLATCWILLGAVRASSPAQSEQQRLSAKRSGRVTERLEKLPLVQMQLSLFSPETLLAGTNKKAQTVREEAGGTAGEPRSDDFEDVLDFIRVTIRRIRRSPSRSVSESSTITTTMRGKTWHKGKRRKKEALKKSSGGTKEDMSRRSASRGRAGQGQDCVLKQIQLNVTDLGLGYHSSEEMIFRYCSGPCRKSLTNYDKILSNLLRSRNIPFRDKPLQACCRPLEFDDDLSFLDDNMVYHTVKKHSARKCGCV